MKTFTKIFALTFLSLLVFSFGVSVYAQNTSTSNTDNYVPLAPIPDTTIGGCGGGVSDPNCKTNLQTYLPGIIKFSIDIAAVLAFVMITAGGIWYATSDAIYGKDEAKNIIQNAIYGLVLVIGAYVILYTINPQTLQINLDWPKPDISQPPTVITSTDCPNTCVSVAATGLPTKVTGNIDATFAQKLKALNQSSYLFDPNVVQWDITEATGDNSGVNHQDPCHSNGTCVDANISDPSITNIKAFFAGAKDAGINASYEVKTQQALDELQASGIPISPNCSGNGTACLNTAATAPHFHIK